MLGLTERQKAAVKFVARYHARYYCSPTCAEVAKHLEISESAAQSLIGRAVKGGYLIPIVPATGNRFGGWRLPQVSDTSEPSRHGFGEGSLTDDQIILVRYITDYWEKNNRSPTPDEASEYFGVNRRTAYVYLQRLAKNGVLVPVRVPGVRRIQGYEKPIWVEKSHDSQRTQAAQKSNTEQVSGEPSQPIEFESPTRAAADCHKQEHSASAPAPGARPRVRIVAPESVQAD
jgi:transposase